LFNNLSPISVVVMLLYIINFKFKLNFMFQCELSKLKKLMSSALWTQLMKVQADSSNGNLKSSYILDQVLGYGKTRYRWSEPVIRWCIIWRAKSTRAYEFARTVVKLPSSSTLKRYMGPIDYSAGMTSSIIQRLSEESHTLTRIERHCSIIFDEMSVKPMLNYVRRAGRFIGYANVGRAAETRMLADRLLCFVVKGLNTNYRIPVAYYHTRQLSGEELSELIESTIIQVENCGFFVVRVVCDNSKVNVKAYTQLCKGALTHQIPHPCDPNRPLFLSFDYCHIIKCLRNIFMDQAKKLKNGGKLISGDFVRRLYESEKDKIIKQARHLSRKVVYPNNFEKMNVRRAVILFSNEVTASIDFQRSIQNSDFGESRETTEFMKLCTKWFQVIRTDFQVFVEYVNISFSFCIF